MTKYSTGNSAGTGDETSCELCGEITDDLREVLIAGANLSVCSECRRHEEQDAPSPSPSSREKPSGSPGSNVEKSFTHPQERQEESSPLWNSDTSHWEEGGANYDADPLPYLISGYGERVREARVAQGLTMEELARAVGITEKELFAVEQGNAATMGVGGSVIGALEDFLEIELAEESE